ncbi:hypothetical protein GILI108418_03185 [Gillisia limnaea]|uniref:Uncharacterized protein n=2 Tax=Gillisia TaxID=244698 RepID=H2BVF6_GILLR|nr:hypothetical protein Gilli_2231 [Gillisia limnaea DSM 15749]
MNFWNKIFLMGILLVISFTTSTTQAQNMLQGEPSMEIREMAHETTAMFTKELGLTGKQEILMEKELITYAMKKEVLLLSKMQEEAKAQRLLALQQAENAAMREILVKPQYERYLVIQQKLLHEQLKNKEKH